MDLRLRGAISGRGANLTLREEVDGLGFWLLTSKEDVEAVDVVADDGRVLAPDEGSDLGGRRSESVRGLDDISEDTAEATEDDAWSWIVLGISRESLLGSSCSADSWSGIFKSNDMVNNESRPRVALKRIALLDSWL